MTTRDEDVAAVMAAVHAYAWSEDGECDTDTPEAAITRALDQERERTLVEAGCAAMRLPPHMSCHDKRNTSQFHCTICRMLTEVRTELGEDA